MPGRLPVGPYRIVDVEAGAKVPWYIIPFHAKGRCIGPLTRNHLLSQLQGGSYTDIFLFAHGWNNDWKAATERYEHFLQGYIQMRRSRSLTYPRDFRPVLVGVFWPSTALVLPWERGPIIAAPATDDPERMDTEVAQEQQAIQELAQAIAPEDVDRFYTLAQKELLSEAETQELARLLLPLYVGASRSDDEIPAKGPPVSLNQLLELWRQTGGRSRGTSGEFGFADEPTAPRAAADMFRNFLRGATVLQMKDRAGTVGAHGVGEMLNDLLARSDNARIHLIGHSYGCKVVLSALCFQAGPRPVNSVLLLQPAISYLSFAEDATGSGQPGGYRVALERVQQPILTTFSSHDQPLTSLFHLAVRRTSDIGEARIAGAPPNRYAALGGFGPGGCDADCREIPIKAAGDRYDLGRTAPRIYALNSAEAISAHGDVSNEHTWWALYNQVING